MTSRERAATALAHREPDRVPVDFGSTFVTGIHVSVVAVLREHFGLDKEPVRIVEPGQMLGEVAEDLKQALGVDAEGVSRRGTTFGFPAEGWKPWRMPNGLEVLVPGGFTVTVDVNGDTLLYPQSDSAAPPSARMPTGGYFFDNIERQPPLDDGCLDPRDNLIEFQAIQEDELDHLEQSARCARATGRLVVAEFGGTNLGGIGGVLGPGLKRPKGIRSATEWYIATRMRPDFVHEVFEGQCQAGLANLARIAERVRDNVDVISLCGTDFGGQSSLLYSVATFNDLWAPYYRRLNGWIHKNARWRTFKHSCGAVEKLIPSFIECGFDILNPVQCSAAGMVPQELKAKYGDRVVFWGGGVDTQSVLPFGTPAQVREQVLRRCEVFAAGGGFVFNTVHNIQAQTPVENVVAMVEAIREFNGA